MNRDFDRERSRPQDALKPVRDHAAVRQTRCDRDQSSGVALAVKSKITRAGRAVAERIARHEPAVKIIVIEVCQHSLVCIARRGCGTASGLGGSEQGGEPAGEWAPADESRASRRIATTFSLTARRWLTK